MNNIYNLIKMVQIKINNYFNFLDIDNLFSMHIINYHYNTYLVNIFNNNLDKYQKIIKLYNHQQKIFLKNSLLYFKKYSNFQNLLIQNLY